MAQIVWFENYEPTDVAVLGGKNSSLGTLLLAGLPVPPGFAVSADCYRKAITIIRDHPDSYDPGFEAVFQKLVDRLETQEDAADS